MRLLKLAPLGIYSLTLCLSLLTLGSGCSGDKPTDDNKIVPPAPPVSDEEKAARQKIMQKSMQK